METAWRVKNFAEKKSIDNLSLLSYREEIASKSQNEWYEEIVNEFPPNIIRSACFWIDSILSASSAVRPVCQTGAAYSITGRTTAEYTSIMILVLTLRNSNDVADLQQSLLLLTQSLLFFGLHRMLVYSSPFHWLYDMFTVSLTVYHIFVIIDFWMLVYF